MLPNCFRFYIVICFLGLAELHHGQTRSEMPVVYASYSEDFKENKTFPSVCFSEAFEDSLGRYWLNTCHAEGVDRLHLYQFDGHDFSLVTNILDSLPSDAQLSGRLREHVFLGAYGESPKRLFTVDLQKQTFAEVAVADKSNWPRKVDDYTVLSLASVEGEWLVQKWNNTKLTTRVVKKPSKLQEVERDLPTYNAYLINEEIWAWWYHENRLSRTRIVDGSTTVFDLTQFIPSDEPQGSPRQALVSQTGNEILVKIRLTGREILLKLHSPRDQFALIPHLKTPEKKVDGFADEFGNLLFNTMDLAGNHQAFLFDTKGQWYNYSQVMRGIEGAEINHVGGRDFKVALNICSTAGFHLRKLAQTRAIDQYLATHSIRAMAQISEDEVLVTTQGNDRFILNLSSKQVAEFNTSFVIEHRNLVPDTGRIHWIGTHTGLARLNQGAKSRDMITTAIGRVPMLTKSEGGRFALLDTENRIYLYNSRDAILDVVERSGIPVEIGGRVHDMLFDNNRLWLAASSGLWRVALSTGEVEVLGFEEPFADSRFLCIDQDASGHLWLGTATGGLHIYDPGSNSAQVLDVRRGLANNTVVSVQPDRQGWRWVSTYNGVSIVSEEGELISNLYVSDGLVHSENNRYANLMTTDGKILIGTVSGLNVIDPGIIREALLQNRELHIYLTSVEYNNTNGEQVHIDWFEQLDKFQGVTLPASKRSISLSYSLSNHFNPRDNQYLYKLEGRDEAWRPIGNQHFLTFDDLAAGDYTLLIKGSDSNGNQTRNQIKIEIKAKEYFHKTLWFYLLCAAVVGGLVTLWIIRLRSEVARATQKIRQDKEVIEAQTRQLKELDHAKSRFFTNISHEFRTPLTVISGMATQILESPQVWATKGAEMIRQSSQTLLSLVNQILDLRKLESAELKLHPVQGDLVKYVKYLIESFSGYATQQNRELLFAAAAPTLLMDYDPEKIMQIISNLVTNAIKYSDDGDRIEVRVDKKQHDHISHAIIEVMDTGPGIPSEQLPHIFDRFFQGSDSKTAKSGGTGIGLALTRELVRLMDGTIGVESRVGQGSTFIITLPVTRSAPLLSGETVIPGGQQTASQEAVLQEHATLQSAAMDNRETILVVEDNAAVRDFLQVCLAPHYELITANDGQSGIELAIQHVPDIIISDVMMPHKDGFELCTTLKQDARTDHIPIVLLTAKADHESRITGLKFGADDYLSKPFEQKELLARLHNLLVIRRKLQTRYATDGANLRRKDDVPLSTQDLFMQKLDEVIAEHLSDDSFGVLQLGRAMTLGRTQLHNKIKALTGMSTTIYIRYRRLLKARELLHESDLTISEIAYDVGFRDPKYFSRAFTEVFGVPPSRTRK